MDVNELQNQISGLDDQALVAIERAIHETRQKKATGVDLDDIKPGMGADATARARAEINKILAGR